MIFDKLQKLNIYQSLHRYHRLLCTNRKEPTKYPKSTEQISVGIWSTDETSHDRFSSWSMENILLTITLDLQRIIFKSSQMNLMVKNFLTKILLPWKLGYHGNSKQLFIFCCLTINYFYIGHINYMGSKFFIILTSSWKPSYHNNIMKDRLSLCLDPEWAKLWYIQSARVTVSTC